MMSKKAIIKIELQIRQYELSVCMLQAQLGYLKDKYPLQHAEAFLHALRVNEEKITEIKTLLEKLEKDENK